nr:hypothetical protein D3W47_01285 [Deinococcus sp. RM]
MSLHAKRGQFGLRRATVQQPPVGQEILRICSDAGHNVDGQGHPFRMQMHLPDQPNDLLQVTGQ